MVDLPPQYYTPSLAGGIQFARRGLAPIASTAPSVGQRCWETENGRTSKGSPVLNDFIWTHHGGEDRRSCGDAGTSGGREEAVKADILKEGSWLLSTEAGVQLSSRACVP